jgi:hypothetical protein
MISIAHMPTLEQLIKWLAPFGVTYQNTPPHRHLIRTVMGRPKIAYLPRSLKDDDTVTATLVRSICAQLGIPPEKLGVILD